MRGRGSWEIHQFAFYRGRWPSPSLHLGAGVVRRDPTDDDSDITKPPLFPTVRFRAKPETNIMSERLVDTGELRSEGPGRPGHLYVRAG